MEMRRSERERTYLRQNGEQKQGEDDQLQRLSVELQEVVFERELGLHAQPDGDVRQVGVEAQHGQDGDDDVEDFDEKVRDDVRCFVLREGKRCDSMRIEQRDNLQSVLRRYKLR